MIEFAKGFDGKEDYCLLIKQKDYLDYCDFLEIARLMNWTVTKKQLQVDVVASGEIELI